MVIDVKYLVLYFEDSSNFFRPAGGGTAQNLLFSKKCRGRESNSHEVALAGF